MKRLLSTRLAGLVLAAGLLASAPAFALGLDPAFPDRRSGPARRRGSSSGATAVRSTPRIRNRRPRPICSAARRRLGRHALRPAEPRRHADRQHQAAGRTRRRAEAEGLQAGHAGRPVVWRLPVADGGRRLAEVDAVVATAPAAYGSFDDFYDSWRLNATKLYPLLERVKRARVMVFYFHGDDFDPGGRGERSREILAERGLGYAVVDQPAYLTTHWAASTGLFLRRFGGCIRDFANNEELNGEMACTPRWGTMPSAELKLPPDMVEPRAPRARRRPSRDRLGRRAASGKAAAGSAMSGTASTRMGARFCSASNRRRATS